MTEPITENRISWKDTASCLQSAGQKYQLQMEENNKSYVALKQEEIIYRFSPAIILPPLLVDSEQYWRQLPENTGMILILLMRAGAASLGVWIDGKLLKHKVITKYMTRKKQGKAQITYLHTKGKSRAGSRIRLRQTLEFFIEINEKLYEWKEQVDSCQKIYYFCPVRLWRELFMAKTLPPFEKEDSRLAKIPLHVNTPSYKELRHIIYELAHGHETIWPEP